VGLVGLFWLGGARNRGLRCGNAGWWVCFARGDLSAESWVVTAIMASGFVLSDWGERGALEQFGRVWRALADVRQDGTWVRSAAFDGGARRRTAKTPKVTPRVVRGERGRRGWWRRRHVGTKARRHGVGTRRRGRKCVAGLATSRLHPFPAPSCLCASMPSCLLRIVSPSVRLARCCALVIIFAQRFWKGAELPGILRGDFWIFGFGGGREFDQICAARGFPRGGRCVPPQAEADGRLNGLSCHGSTTK
jgi:hypothetical protein